MIIQEKNMKIKAREIKLFGIYVTKNHKLFDKVSGELNKAKNIHKRDYSYATWTGMGKALVTAK